MTPVESAALEASVKTAEGFFARIFGPQADAYGQLRADNMNVRRLKNQIERLKDVRKIVEEEGLNMKQVNLKALFPLLEGIGLEEEETLQDMWVSLFTNYIDTAKNLTTHVYPQILKQLSTEEIDILKLMKNDNDRIRVMNRNTLHGKPTTEFVYLDQLTNLERLGIVVEVPVFKASTPKPRLYNGVIRPKQDAPIVKQWQPDYYVISDFGNQFLEACKR